ncbi:MAG: hypothetical protein EBR30_24055 [Cytophagia bacterium]|nr:hypothetical protein [Cytophagia bacterium]
MNNKYNIGDLIVDQDEGEVYTITQILRFIDDSYGYDTEYYDKDNNRILEHYMSEKHIETILSGKHEIKAKYYPVTKD